MLVNGCDNCNPTLRAFGQTSQHDMTAVEADTALYLNCAYQALNNSCPHDIHVRSLALSGSNTTNYTWVVPKYYMTSELVL